MSARGTDALPYRLMRLYKSPLCKKWEPGRGPWTCVRNSAENKFLNFHIGEARGVSWRNPLREFALFCKEPERPWGSSVKSPEEEKFRR